MSHIEETLARVTRGRWTVLSVAAVLGAGALVAGCGSDNNSNSSSGGGSVTGKKIALLLPEHTTARYETQDRPNFENEIKQLS